MIVEPTPTTPRSPWRRALRVGGLVAPLVLLAGVIGAGVLGPKPEPPSPGASLTAVLATPATSPAVAAAETGPPAPAQFGDLATTSPADLVAARADGSVGDAAVAVAGYLAIAGADACNVAVGGPLGPWCAREGILFESPFSSGGVPSTDGASRPPHVHVIVPVGVRLPLPVALDTEAGRESHVLLVGRFDPAVACGIGGRCDNGFIVDRFAWANGVRSALTPLLADRLDTGRRRANPFALALDTADLPLVAVLAWPDAIASMDPNAAAVAARQPRGEPLWYLRVLDGAREPGMVRRVRWMLLAETDLRVIGAGRAAGVPVNVPAPQASPGMSPAASPDSPPGAAVARPGAEPGTRPGAGPGAGPGARPYAG